MVNQLGAGLTWFGTPWYSTKHSCISGMTLISVCNHIGHPYIPLVNSMCKRPIRFTIYCDFTIGNNDDYKARKVLSQVFLTSNDFIWFVWAGWRHSNDQRNLGKSRGVPRFTKWTVIAYHSDICFCIWFNQIDIEKQKPFWDTPLGPIVTPRCAPPAIPGMIVN